MLVVVVFLFFAQAASAGNAKCTPGETARLNEALQLMTRGDVAAARNLLQEGQPFLTAEALAKAVRAGDRSNCPALELARLAVDGWFTAREAARGGGAPELLAPVRLVLEQIKALAGTKNAGSAVFDLQVEYAEITIRAAMAAAQDERPEMQLLLDHAGDLVQRLEQRSTRPVWPRTYNLVVGELWFEVDRFEEARAAYARAVQADASAAALVGLARAEARLGLMEQACATYKRAKDVSPALRALAARDLARCF
jgi:tetratricopeptide (TPR) repeat protein